jgi:hypothetical protein
MDFINRVIAVFGEWRKGSVFNLLITLQDGLMAVYWLYRLTENDPEYLKEYSKSLKKRVSKQPVSQNIKQSFVFVILLNFNVRGHVAGYLCQNFF